MSASKLKEEGNAAFKAGQFQKAIDIYTEALQLDTDETLKSILLSNRCVSYCKLKMYTEALKDAELCIEVRPDWFKAYARCGEALEYLGYRRETIKCYKKGLERCTEKGVLEKQLKNLIAREKDKRNKRNPFTDHDVMDRIILHPELLAICDEDDVPPMVIEMRSQPEIFDKLQTDKRIVELAETLREFDDIEELYEDGVFTRYRRHVKKFKTAEQRDKLPKFILQKMPPEPKIEDVLEPFTDPEQCCEKARERRKACRYDQAMVCYRKAQSMRPKDMQYVYDEASIPFYQQKFEVAAPIFERALKVGEEFGAEKKLIALAKRDLGTCHLRNDDFDRAVELLTDSDQMVPKDKETSLRLDDALYYQKKKRKMDFFDADIALEQKNLGKRFFNVKKLETAIVYFTEAIKREPEKRVRARCYRKRGMCYFHLKEYDKAIFDGCKSMKLDPKYRKGFYLKGDSYFQKGLISGDRDDFMRSLNAYKRCKDIGDLPTRRAMDGFQIAYEKVDPTGEVNYAVVVSQLGKKYD